MIVLVIILVLVCLGCIFYVKALRARLFKLSQSDRLKTAFIKGLSREIRTQLHSVSGLAEVISREDLYLSKGEKKDISNQIKYNARLIATVLDEVAVLSGDDNERGHQLQDERFSPNILCQRCLDANRSYAHEGVRLVFSHDVDNNFFVSADRHIVELILNKLVACACKFTEQGEIKMGCRRGDPSHLITFYVQDTGGGIPEDRKNSLFKWFDDPDVAAEPTEFDLSVAQRLASKLGGYLRFDETWQQGTRLEFTLPVR